MAAFSQGRCACGGTLRWADDEWFCGRCGDECHDETLRGPAAGWPPATASTAGGTPAST